MATYEDYCKRRGIPYTPPVVDVIPEPKEKPKKKAPAKKPVAKKAPAKKKASATKSKAKKKA